MFFSIVVPLYNKAYSIKRCIDSVLSQDFLDFELIVVNDGSTDNSLEIVKDNYGNDILKGVIKIVDQNNQGVSIARNNGVKLAQSNFICFLDADDEWKSDFLKNMAALINEFPEADLYSLAHLVSKNSSQPIKVKHGLPDGFHGYIDDFFNSSSQGCVVNSSKVCVRKKALLYIGGFPAGVVAGEDLYVWIVLALNGNVACSMRYSAIIHQAIDNSRMSRESSVPYPFVYFSKNKYIKKTKSLNKYLFFIFYKHLLSSLIRLKFKEAGLRIYYYLRVYV